jgi:hypothetical protein
MGRAHDLEGLHVAVTAGVEVGPADRRRFEVVADAILFDGIDVLPMEMMGTTDPRKTHQGGSDILVIARGQDAAASATEPFDSIALRGHESIAGVYPEHPELVERRLCEPRKRLIDSILTALEVAGRHLDSRKGRKVVG